MESVIATVTGYRGGERFKLIRLIASIGAIYVGRMNRSVTHLVCWRYEGRKYEIAKRLNIVIVNHGWIEECVKRGTIVSEEPYRFQSGEEIAPLRADIKLWINQAKPRPRASIKAKKLVIDVDSEDTDNAPRTASIQFDELKEESCSHPKNFRRLRKRYSVPSEPQRNPSSLRNKISNLDNWLLSSKTEQNSKKIKVLPNRDSSGYGSKDSHVEGFRGTYKRRCNWNGEDDPDGCSDDKQTEGCSNGNEDACIHDAQTSVLPTGEEFSQAAYEDHGAPSSSSLSCVICWTDFSSTRGALPCGHRFCFSCIQNWADHMASRNKPSTCPLCKATFICITKLEASVTSDQKIYSQSMPDDISNVHLYVLPGEACGPPGNLSAAVCFRCSSREPEDLLIQCHLCRIRCVHSYCLDPPLFPWTCVHCKDLQTLYHNL